MSLYNVLNESLQSLLGDRATTILEEGLRRLGTNPDDLDLGHAETLLKRLVYRELQTTMAASAARQKVEDIIEQIKNAPTSAPAPIAAATTEQPQAEDFTQSIVQLEAGLKRFNLYLDWSEVSSLRGCVNALKQGADAPTTKNLVREGQDLLQVLDERLQEALLIQSKDIADLQTAYERVKSVGGPKPKRLKTLLEQIEEAHANDTLAPAEVERGRSIAVELKKLVASSVVQTAPAEVAIMVEDDDDHFEAAPEPIGLAPQPPAVIAVPDLIAEPQVPQAVQQPVVEPQAPALDHYSLLDELMAPKPVVTEVVKPATIEEVAGAVDPLEGEPFVEAQLHLTEETAPQAAPAQAEPIVSESIGAQFQQPTIDFEFEDSSFELDLDFNTLTMEQIIQHKAIDLEEETRRLDTMGSKYGIILQDKAVSIEFTNLKDQLVFEGEPLGEALDEFENKLKTIHQERLADFRVRFDLLQTHLNNITLRPTRYGTVHTHMMSMAEILNAGVLPNNFEQLEIEMRELEVEAQEMLAAKQKQEQLERAFESAKQESKASLDEFKKLSRVHAFLEMMDTLEVTEPNLQHLRAELGALLMAVSQEQEQEGLKRKALNVAIANLPAYDNLAEEKAQLLASVDALPLNQLEQLLAGLQRNALSQAADHLNDYEQRIAKEQLGRFASELLEQVSQGRERIEAGQIFDTTSLEGLYKQALEQRRHHYEEELGRLDTAARSMRGLGGEELEQWVANTRTAVARGGYPPLEQGVQLNSSIRANIERVRTNVESRILKSLDSYNLHKAIGGETVQHLEPKFKFLESSVPRLAKLGANGLVEIRRSLEDFEKGIFQLEQEYGAAQSLRVELTSSPQLMEDLLGVFDLPEPIAPIAPAKSSKNPVVAYNPGHLEPLLKGLELRGVEGAAVVKDGAIAWGDIPFSSASAGTFFAELGGLANELFKSTAQLSVITLANSVLIMVPLQGIGLVVLAEKPLLSRLLVQIDKIKEAL